MSNKTIKQTRKKHSSKVKFQVMLEVLQENKNQAEIARSYGLHGNLISNWKKEFLENGHKIFEMDNNRAEKVQSKKVEELEQIIGKQTVEIALLKKFLGHYRSD